MKWMWQSVNPGSTSRPPALIILAPGVRQRATSPVLPTATMRSPRMASDEAQGCLGFTV
jgi:hypothetical protein